MSGGEIAKPTDAVAENNTDPARRVRVLATLGIVIIGMIVSIIAVSFRTLIPPAHRAQAATPTPEPASHPSALVAADPRPVAASSALSITPAPTPTPDTKPVAPATPEPDTKPMPNGMASALASGFLMPRKKPRKPRVPPGTTQAAAAPSVEQPAAAAAPPPPAPTPTETPESRHKREADEAFQ
jgi:hypothetical protein